MRSHGRCGLALSATWSARWAPLRRFSGILVCGVLLPVSRSASWPVSRGDAPPVSRPLERRARLRSLLIALVCTPMYAKPSLPAAIFVYMSLLLVLALGALWQRARRVEVELLAPPPALLGEVARSPRCSPRSTTCRWWGRDPAARHRAHAGVPVHSVRSRVARELLDLYELAARLAVLTASPSRWRGYSGCCRRSGAAASSCTP